jgi:hypothetical protein
MNNRYFMANAQTRMEVFCRVLLLDVFNNIQPADMTVAATQFLGELSCIVATSFADYSRLHATIEDSGPTLQSILQIPDEPYVKPWFALVSHEPETSLFSASRFIKRFNEFCDLIEPGWDRDIYTLMSFTPGLCADFRMQADYEQRVLILTEMGLLGMGPLESQAGDVVWVLAGSRTPVLLRKATEGRWKLIGEVYIHGIMHGEVTDWGRPLEDILLE